MTEYAAIIPMTIVALSAIAAMLAEAIRRPGERMPIAGFGLIGSIGAGVASAFLWGSEAESFGVIRSDNFALFINIVLCLIGVLTMLFSHDTIERENIPAGEYYALTLFALCGMMMMAAATDLLVDDLAWMAEQWGANGEALKRLEQGGDEAGLTAIMTGLGSLSYGELAGERMKLGLMIHDPEEEHDCFSDNTHASHFFDALGIRNVYLGTYRRVDRSLLAGPSISDLVKAKSPEVDAEVRAKLDATMDAMNAMYLRALTTESYDQMIGEGNDAGNAVVERVVQALLDQTKSIERAVAVLDLKAIEFEGSDSLDKPSKVEVGTGAEGGATP